MNTCKIVEGRLMEINVTGGYRSVEDVDTMMQLIKETIGRVGKPVVIFADWRHCGLFSDSVAERVTWMLTRDNPMVDRSAILHDDTHKVLLLQVARLIREGGHTNRRVFTDGMELSKYLGERLTLAERDRLDALLHPMAAPAR